MRRTTLWGTTGSARTIARSISPTRPGIPRDAPRGGFATGARGGSRARPRGPRRAAANRTGRARWRRRRGFSGPGRSRRRPPAEPRLRPREPGERTTSRHQPNGRLHEPEREQRDADAAQAAPMYAQPATISAAGTISARKGRSASPRCAHGTAAGGPNSKRCSTGAAPPSTRTSIATRSGRPLCPHERVAAARAGAESAEPLRALAGTRSRSSNERPDDHVGAQRARAAVFDHDAELAALGAQLTAGSDPHAAGDDLPRGAPIQRCGQRPLVDGQVDDPPGAALPPQPHRARQRDTAALLVVAPR